MKFPWSKEEESVLPTPIEVVRWRIPNENLEEVYSLHWEMVKERGNNLLANYKFWEAIKRIIPEEYSGINIKMQFVSSATHSALAEIVFISEDL